MTALVCEGSSAVLHCPEESAINIQSAFYGRKKDDICPHLGDSGGAVEEFWTVFGKLVPYHCFMLIPCSAGTCTVDGVLPLIRKICDNRRFCFAYAHVDQDPCPTVSKYLEIVYSCEQEGYSTSPDTLNFFITIIIIWPSPGVVVSLPSVCLHGLGVEDGLVTDSQLTASSSTGGFTPDKARLNGNSCWMPSGSRKEN